MLYLKLALNRGQVVPGVPDLANVSGKLQKCVNNWDDMTLTRMHSSRMRTGRSLTVYRSLLPGGCLLRLCVCSRGSGVCSGGLCLLWGCSPGGGCLLRGVWYPSMHWGRHPPREQNDRQVQKYYLGHNFVAAGKNLWWKLDLKTTSIYCMLPVLKVVACFVCVIFR